jgi:hypothetical protein
VQRRAGIIWTVHGQAVEDTVGVELVKILRGPGVSPTAWAPTQGVVSRRVATGLGCAVLGVLAVSAGARGLFRSGRSPSTDAADGAEPPDVLLDVSELEVDRISLEVEDLRAHVSVQAELANLVRLSVGVDATLDRVKLEIEGVEAKVLLKVRLRHIRAILEKALDIVADNPEILRILSRSFSRLVRESLGEAQTTLADILEELEVGDTVDEALRGRLEAVRGTLEEILDRPALGDGSEAPSLEGLGGGTAGEPAPSSESEE